MEAVFECRQNWKREEENKRGNAGKGNAAREGGEGAYPPTVLRSWLPRTNIVGIRALVSLQFTSVKVRTMTPVF